MPGWVFFSGRISDVSANQSVEICMIFFCKKTVILPHYTSFYLNWPQFISFYQNQFTSYDLFQKTPLLAYILLQKILSSRAEALQPFLQPLI
jgi:hypothetical protein